MYFITDEPILFNIMNGTFQIFDNPYSAEPYDEPETHHVVLNKSDIVHKGTRQECEDFIYSIAGYVGAVNPTAKVTP